MNIRSELRKVLYNSKVFRNLVFNLHLLPSDSQNPDISHLALFRELNLNGSIQKEEALFLYSIIKMIRPEIVVEFGFCRGYSALNFLKAIDKNCILYSYDISEEATKIAQTAFKRFKNFFFIKKSQLDFSPKDINYAKIDLVLFDAVFDSKINLQTFEILKDSLNDSAIIAIHDTGTWIKKYMVKREETFVKMHGNKGWINDDEYQQRPGQREFINTIINKYPEFEVIHFHSNLTLRCGISLIQKRKVLNTSNNKSHVNFSVGVN